VNFQDIHISKVFRLAAYPAEDMVKVSNTHARLKSGKDRARRLSWRTKIIVAPYAEAPEYIDMVRRAQRKEARKEKSRFEDAGWKSEQELIEALRNGLVDIPAKPE